MTLNQEIGEWEAHTKGIGSKLLEKWGYKKGEGLGKDKQGIAVPVTPVSSPLKNLSLDFVVQFNNLKNSDQNEVESEELTKQFSKFNIGNTSRYSKNETDPVENLENKLASISLSSPNTEFSYTYKEKDNNEFIIAPYFSKDKNFQFRKFFETISPVLDQAIRRCNLLNEKISIQLSEQASSIRNLKSKERDHDAKNNKIAQEIKQLLEFSKFFESWAADYRETPQHYLLLLENFQNEFYTFKINYLAENIFCKQYVEEERDYSEKIPICFYAWKEVIDFPRFTRLWTIIFPEIGDTIRNKWKPRRDTEFQILGIVEELHSLMPLSSFNSLLIPIIVAKLSKCIQKWKPASRHSTRVELHSTIFVWGPILGIEWMDVLFEAVAEKLEEWLTKKEKKGWALTDDSVISCISPWTKLFSDPSMRRIRNFFEWKCYEAIATMPIVRYVPERKALGQFEWIWIPIWARANLVPIETFAAILTSEFFPKWTEDLCDWIKMEGDLQQIDRYYRFWKQMFTREFVERGYLIDIFMEVLRLMQESIPKSYL